MKRFNLTPEERADKVSRHIHPDLPHTIGIVILHGSCNLKCRMCPVFNVSFGKKKIMELRTFERLIEQLPDDGNHDIELTAMGEPLLHPNIDDFIKTLGTQFRRNSTLLVTNGHLLNNSMAQLILDCEIDRLQISINAYGEKNYQWFTGSSGYEKVVDNIENFIHLKEKKNNGLPYMTLHIAGIEEFQNDFEPFLDFWKNKVELARIREVKDWSGITRHNGITPLLSGEISCSRYPCSWLWESIEIYPTGDVYTCSFHPFFKTPPLGNILNHNLNEIWHGEFLQTLRKKHLDGLAQEVDFCEQCTNWYLYPNFWEDCGKNPVGVNSQRWSLPELMEACHE